MVKLVVHESDDKKKLENPGGENVLNRLGGEGAGLPYFAFLDAKGELIVTSKRPIPGKGSENMGYPLDPDDVTWFMSMLKKSAPKLTPAEAGTIENWLKHQKQ